ncbi:hypothetical protein Hanom_Chr05g00398111 [Helianthus anomalus]
MVLDEVGSGVFGITRNNGSIDGKTTITIYNSYDSLIFFCRSYYANNSADVFFSSVRIWKKDVNIEIRTNYVSYQMIQ